MCIVICLVYLLVVVVGGVKFSTETLSETSILAKQGKQHLESITEKANIPQYGPCWTNAVSDLQNGCKLLSESIQSDLALRFTDCFLQMSGQEPLNCRSHKDLCLKQLSDRAFNTYTEFYTYTQSICYFLQSQVWHEEAEVTINKLSSTSALVSQQLAEAEVLQATLLAQQKQGIELQKDLMTNLVLSMEQSQEKINFIMEDFHSFTVEQKKALFDVFDELGSLKAWAVGEVSWLDTLFFYTSSVVIAYLFTSALRTQPARIYIFFLLSVNYVLERIITSWFLDETHSKSTIDSIVGLVNSNIWVCRKVCIALCVVLTLVIAYKYCDYNSLNHELLRYLKAQNDKILKKLDSMTKNKDEGKSEIPIEKHAIPLPYASLVSEKMTQYSPVPCVKRETPQKHLSEAMSFYQSPLPNGSDKELLNKIELLPKDHDRSRSTTPLRRSNRCTKNPVPVYSV